MNAERRRRLEALMRAHSSVEEERLAGTHKSRLANIPFDTRRNAYNFNAFYQGNSAAIAVTRHDRFSATPPHYHNHIELNLMYGGSCTQTIGTEEVTLQPGTVVLVDTNTTHSLSRAEEDDLLINIELNWDYLKGGLLRAFPPGNLLTTFFVNALTNGAHQLNYLVFGIGGDDRLRATLDELVYEAFFPSPMHEQLLDQLFRLAMIDMLQDIDSQLILSHLNGGNRATAEALAWIDTHYLDCTLDEVAREVGMSAPYLTTLLKRATGMSFSQLVIAKRMEVAKEQVLTTDASVETIARACGYENLSFFYRKFREAHGCNPKELRTRGR